MQQLTPVHISELNQNIGFTNYGIIVKNADDLEGKVITNN